MPRIVWGNQTHRSYVSGVDRGVFYPSRGAGVPWNGLVSVEEASEGSQNNAYYFDGVKILELVSPKMFRATITAFSMPIEFSRCIGELPIVPGFILTGQPRKSFGFSYRTLLDSGPDYEIHIVYNATASFTKRSYSAKSIDASAEELTWDVNAVPPKSDTHRPSAHFVIDSTKAPASALSSIENILYGYLGNNPRLPSADELIDILSYWDPAVVGSQAVDGFAQLNPGMGDLSKSKIAGLYRSVPNTRLKQTLVRGLYRLEA